jgi:hypothetical protein
MTLRGIIEFCQKGDIKLMILKAFPNGHDKTIEQSLTVIELYSNKINDVVEAVLTDWL